jgi:hypothetical protein
MLVAGQAPHAWQHFDSSLDRWCTSSYHDAPSDTMVHPQKLLVSEHVSFSRTLLCRVIIVMLVCV